MSKSRILPDLWSDEKMKVFVTVRMLIIVGMTGTWLSDETF